MKKQIVIISGIALLNVASAHAQLFADFETFADATTSGSVMFRQPTFANTAPAYVDTTPNISSVTATFPSGIGGTRALNVQFSIKPGTTDPWLRLTTSSAPNLPNPTIDFTQNLAFDIYTDRSIRLALGVRETSTTAAIGANGGASGNIEFVGASARLAGSPVGPVPTRTIPGGVWTRVVFDIDAEPAQSFTGNGAVTSTTGKGTLEHLAFVPLAGDSGTYNIYLDNFEVTPVPEPGAYALSFGVLALAAGFLRRKWAA